MTVIIETADPKGLMSAIRNRITRGYEADWAIDLDGDFEYCGPDARLLEAAVLRPALEVGRVRVSVVQWKAQRMTKPVRGAYVVAFVGMLMHFSTWIKRVVIEMK